MDPQVNQAPDDGDLNTQFADLDDDAKKMIESGTIDQPQTEVNPAAAADEDDESYSKKVKKRIGREVYKTKKALTRAEVAENELRQKNALIAKMQKEHNTLMTSRLTEEIAVMSKQASKALDDNETEDYMTANDKILDAKVKLARLAEEKEGFVEVEDPAPAAAPAQAPAAAPQDSGLAPAAQEWIDRNSDWINTDAKKFKKAQQLASKLEAEGYDPADPDLYEEIDERLNAAPPPPPPQSFANVPGSSTPTAPAQATNRLSPQDLRNMQTYGLNPQNSEHRKQWLAGKQGV